MSALILWLLPISFQALAKDLESPGQAVGPRTPLPLLRGPPFPLTENRGVGRAPPVPAALIWKPLSDIIPALCIHVSSWVSNVWFLPCLPELCQRGGKKKKKQKTLQHLFSHQGWEFIPETFFILDQRAFRHEEEDLSFSL